MKKTFFILLTSVLSFSILAFAQEGGKKQSEGDTDTKANLIQKQAEKEVPQQFQGKLGELYNLKEASRITYANAKQLLTDESGCVKQTLLLLQRDMEAKENFYALQVNELRDQLAIAKDWQLDIQSMKFVQVKKTTPQP